MKSVLPPLNSVPTQQDIEQTHEAIRPYINKTPLLVSSTLNELLGAQVFFKCENFQKVGAFKFRGACSAVLRLSPKELLQGVAAHSSGNHAQAVALAGKTFGAQATIVMPKGAPEVKKNATAHYGAKIVECGNTIESREETIKSQVEKSGATEIHPYNSYPVIAGQATCAKELVEEQNVDFILAPIGGGGLIAGTCLSAKYFSTAKVIGCEPEEVNEAFQSWMSGVMQKNTTTNTLADGLRTNIGEKNFEIIQREIHDIFCVSEKEIIEATQWVWERMKLIIEPSSAVPVAALLKHKERFKGKRVGIVLTGGNVNIPEISKHF